MTPYGEDKYQRDMKSWTFDKFMKELKIVKSNLKMISPHQSELDRSKEIRELMHKWSLMMNYLKELADVPTNNSDRPSWERLRDERQRRKVQRRHDKQMEQRRTATRRDNMV